jgi:hypothetical protein
MTRRIAMMLLAAFVPRPLTPNSFQQRPAETCPGEPSDELELDFGAGPCRTKRIVVKQGDVVVKVKVEELMKALR